MNLARPDQTGHLSSRLRSRPDTSTQTSSSNIKHNYSHKDGSPDIRTNPRVPRSLSSPPAGLISRMTFTLATAITGYLITLSLTPPNHPRPPQPNAKSPSQIKDTMMRKGSPVSYGLPIARLLYLSLAIIQALSSAVHPSSWTSDMNPMLLQWSPISAVVLASTAAAATFRLRAFSELGTDFTFELNKPRRLVTTGLYRYVQHPSYIASVVVGTLGTWWFVRADGPLVKVVPQGLVAPAMWVQTVGLLVMVFMGFKIGWTRVREEEAMLEEAFGEQWLQWHAKTARFLPYIF